MSASAANAKFPSHHHNANPLQKGLKLWVDGMTQKKELDEYDKIKSNLEVLLKEREDQLK